jgi:hypothetical protein
MEDERPLPAGWRQDGEWLVGPSGTRNCGLWVSDPPHKFERIDGRYRLMQVPPGLTAHFFDQHGNHYSMGGGGTSVKRDAPRGPIMKEIKKRIKEAAEGKGEKPAAQKPPDRTTSFPNSTVAQTDVLASRPTISFRHRRIDRGIRFTLYVNGTSQQDGLASLGNTFTHISNGLKCIFRMGAEAIEVQEWDLQ